MTFLSVFILTFINVDIKIEKGNLIRLEPTNIAYVEPYKEIINENILMFFNEKDMFCINNLNNKFRLCELIYYFKKT